MLWGQSAQSKDSAGAASSRDGAAPSLDFEFFRTRVQPIFLAKRPGHARCIACHAEPGTKLHPSLVPPPTGSALWNEEDSRKNFAEFSHKVIPGSMQSPLLRHPLAEAAGGDAAHIGGKHFSSQSDPEWLILKAWAYGARIIPTGSKVRILQTNSAGDNIHVIDPSSGEVVGEISGIETNHGVVASPDGSRLYVSAESERTVVVVDGKTLGIIKRIPLSGKPNNIAIAPDGKRVYVAIRQEPGGIDVIDTTSLQKTKTIDTRMTLHNTYVTPDGRYVLGGSVEGNAVQVVDARSDQLVASIPLDLGVRPIVLSTNSDGSTQWLFLELNDFNGLVVVDFATRKEIKRIPFPPIAAGRASVPTRGEIAHGLALTPDGKTLLAASRLNAALYFYSLPGMNLVGTAELEGKGANWVTITPDGQRAYVSNTNTNDVSVVDIGLKKEIARIPVGFTPKRNSLWVMP
jgi:YVTN family beta-propeller protein